MLFCSAHAAHCAHQMSVEATSASAFGSQSCSCLTCVVTVSLRLVHSLPVFCAGLPQLSSHTPPLPLNAPVQRPRHQPGAASKGKAVGHLLSHGEQRHRSATASQTTQQQTLKGPDQALLCCCCCVQVSYAQAWRAMLENLDDVGRHYYHELASNVYCERAQNVKKRA